MSRVTSAEASRAEQRGEKLRGGVVVERVEMDGDGVVLAGRRVPTPFEVEPGRGEQEHRQPDRPLEQVVDETEHHVVGPMQLGETDHQRLAPRESLHERFDRAANFGGSAGGVDVGQCVGIAEDVHEPGDETVQLGVVGFEPGEFF